MGRGPPGGYSQTLKMRLKMFCAVFVEAESSATANDLTIAKQKYEGRKYLHSDMRVVTYSPQSF